jgi:phosphatidylglycerophosphatase A
MTGASLQKAVWRDPAYFIAFGFGSGLMPIAPGTWGTLAAIPIYLLMIQLPAFLYLLMVVAGFFLGIFLCNKVSMELGEHDYAGIVWDEVVGYLLTMFLVPPGLLSILLGFFLFRLFDILKPFPIRWVDKHVHGGLGIMLDDLIAALPAFIILQLLYQWIF